MLEPIRVRDATAADIPAVAAIFNQGIAERVATFETHEQSAEHVAELLASRPVALVAEREGEIAAFAWVAPYDPEHDYYAGVGEATLYVERASRRAGVGQALLQALADAAASAGFYKLVGKVFTSNAPSIALLRACGWQQVGVHRRHGLLDGAWKDVLVVEILVGDAATE